MSDLLAILSYGANSLAAHRAASATASHNLQNVNTPGFARQRAELEAVQPAYNVHEAWIGRGATLGTVSQARDRFVEAQLPAGFGNSARSTAEADALEALSALDPEGGAGLSTAMNAFFAAGRAMSLHPGDPSLRTAFLGASRSLALAFNRTAESIEGARSGVDAKLEGVLGEANRSAARVAELNVQIQISRASGAEPNDLLDARQRELDNLATLVGGRPVPNASGHISVFLPGGAALVSGNSAGVLSTVIEPANGGHLALRLTPAGSTTAQPLGTGLGGTLGGLLDARDGALLTAGRNIDQLAFDLGTALNNLHSTGYGIDGSTGNRLFELGGASDGAARAMSLVLTDPRQVAAAASVSSGPADGTNLLAMLALETATVSNGLTPAGALARGVSDFGSAAARARGAAEQDSAILGHLQGLRESVSGVSIDEEMMNLTKAQRAFEATMKVMQTADSMLETLLKLR